MNLQVGSTVGDYQVIGILGAGGMGQVYKVRNVISDRVEAMKVLLPDLANQPELADRFLREIKVQASLEHPNIAALHTAVRVDNQLVMLMEFVEGVTLDQKLKDGPLPCAEALNYITQVLSALEYAHARGVVHRDIKPANMILTPAGVVKLMDFGIARSTADHKLTQTGMTVGSLYYMSPEQIQGVAAPDSRSDLYSVGVSLYELVTGKRPFDGDSQFAIMSAHLQGTPVPPIALDPRLPQALNDAVLMSVAKDANSRFQTAAALRNALAQVTAGLPAATSAPSPIQSAAASRTPSPNFQGSPIQPGAPLAATPAPRTPSPYAPGSPLDPAAPLAPTGYRPNEAGAPQNSPIQSASSAAINEPVSARRVTTVPVGQLAPSAQAVQAKSHRGAWMALGAVAVLVIIAVVAVAPWKGTGAAMSPATVPAPLPVTQQPPPQQPPPLATQPPRQEPQSSSQAMSQASSKPISQPQSRPSATTAAPAPSAPRTETPIAKPSTTSAAKAVPAVPSSVPPPQPAQQPATPTTAQPATSRQSAPAGPSREELQQMREHLGMLGVRSVGVHTSLDTLQRSQAARGMTLRGDMVEASTMMNSYLEAASAALNAGDITQAKSFADKAERQLEKLEKFLNR